MRLYMHELSCTYLIEVCWCYAAGVVVGDVEILTVHNEQVSSGSAYTRIPHHQQPIPLHNTNTPQVSTLQPTQ